MTCRSIARIPARRFVGSLSAMQPQGHVSMGNGRPAAGFAFNLGLPRAASSCSLVRDAAS